MLFIGIVDYTTVGSTIAQRRISELGGITGDHPEFAVHSIPFKKYRDAIVNNDVELEAELIKESIANLNKLDVDFIIIPANTPHYLYDEFSKDSKAPILNLIDITVAECQRLGLKKVVVLGTKKTMTGGLYAKKLVVQGIQAVIPSGDVCDSLDDYIMEDLIPGKINNARRTEILQHVNQLDCDGLILGCTELPEVYNSLDFNGKPAIDTTRLIAEKAFDIAMNHRHDLL
ncbi:MAG: aspartate/glutamate racemase family protein [Gammaproteobacteria bacterium]|nr:aspartate/glutamate racemase family protein [Gammaproteobacteria bacterium]